jgi:XTP/dITP diphosphohydrolase
MKSLVFATNNMHKLEEISTILSHKIQLVSLNDLNCFDEIPEDKDTLEGNALQKANYIYRKYNLNCFADDTGLEVESLNSRPGVYSARYSEFDFPNIPKDERAEANIRKLLLELKGKQNKNAAFRTIICLIENGEIKYFEGKIEGKIIDEQRGLHGFGYDPVFVPNGFKNTFAEMNLELKNTISHRGLAINKLTNYLLNTNKS